MLLVQHKTVKPIDWGRVPNSKECPLLIGFFYGLLVIMAERFIILKGELDKPE